MSLSRRTYLKGMTAVAAGTAAAFANPAFIPKAHAATTPITTPKMADILARNWGVNTHFTYRTSTYNDARTTALLADLGVRLVRDKFPEANSYDSGLRARYTELRAAGIQIHGAAVLPDDTTQQIQDRIDLAAAITNDFPGIWASFGGQNEPNNGTNWVPATLSRQEALYNAVSGNSNGAINGLPVSPPALRAASTTIQQDFIDLAQGETPTHHNISDICTVGDFHYYPGGKRPTGPSTGPRLDDFVGWAKNAFGSGKPLYNTEGGYNTGLNVPGGPNEVSVEVQGIYAPRQLLELYLQRYARFWTYEFMDDPDPGDTATQAHWGIVGVGGQVSDPFTPNPAYWAMRNLIHLVSDTGTPFTPTSLAGSINYAGSDLKQALLQRRSGAHLLLLWRDADVPDEKAHSFSQGDIQAATVALGQSAKVEEFQPTMHGSGSAYDPPVRTIASTTSVTVQLQRQVHVLRITPL